ncbi:30S ribosomal protein S20 [Candidatus Saccharibacteria bacterium]|nr:30S ribosomal protein S20 [Candidatus Saccharibacteria bacterium]
MPIIKSAIKRAKQSLTRRSRNLQTKRAVKADVLAVHNAIETGEHVDEMLAAAYSEIDRAVKKHTLHKNTAARRKSQLAAAVAKITGDAPVVEAKTTKGAGAGAKKATTKKAPAAKAPVAKKAPAKKAAPKAAAKTDDKK